MTFGIVKTELEENGFFIVRNAIAPEMRRDLIAALGPVLAAGRRGLLALPTVSALARSKWILDLVRPHLQNEPIPVRGIYFDKSSETNWLVPWHQDLTLAVRASAEVAGYGPWSTKDGIPHVQPPIELLEQMLTVRLHLDDADESNGALRVLPGSHRLGRLTTKRIQELRGELPEVICLMGAGDLLLMRPLLLHASSRSTSPRHRRALHIEYAGFSLPLGLDWHNAA